MTKAETRAEIERLENSSNTLRGEAKRLTHFVNDGKSLDEIAYFMGDSKAEVTNAIRLLGLSHPEVPPKKGRRK